jgi:hypothetical protein
MPPLLAKIRADTAENDYSADGSACAVGAHRPSVATPVRGLYLAGDSAGGRGIGTELVADSAMECAERILTDLGRPIPTAWGTGRYRQPHLSRLVANTST